MPRLRNVIATAKKIVFRGDDRRSLGPFTLSGRDIEERRSATPGPLEEAFYRHQGRLVRKWAHYLPVYEELFSAYRGTDVHMLEIGVSKGGSLEMWREYFGPQAVIYGIDVNPTCAENVDEPNQVRIGSQADPRFLDAVLSEMEHVDIVLDDGSHVAEHQSASFKHLYPQLVEGGLYLIEDMHTSYWAQKFSGGYRRKGTAIEIIKDLIDDMHGWYHSRGSRRAPRNEIDAIMVFDSIAAVRKTRRPRPGIVDRPEPT